MNPETEVPVKEQQKLIQGDLIGYVNPRTNKFQLGVMKNPKLRPNMKKVYLDVLDKQQGTQINIENFVPVTVYMTRAALDKLEIQ